MGLGMPLISGGNNLIKCLNVLSTSKIVKHGLHDCHCYSAAGSGGVDVPLAMPGPQFPHWLVSHTVITTTTTGKWCRSGVQEMRRLLQTHAKRPLPLSPVPSFVHRRGAASLKASEDGCFGVLSIGMT